MSAEYPLVDKWFKKYIEVHKGVEPTAQQLILWSKKNGTQLSFFKVSKHTKSLQAGVTSNPVTTQPKVTQTNPNLKYSKNVNNDENLYKSTSLKNCNNNQHSSEISANTTTKSNDKLLTDTYGIQETIASKSRDEKNDGAGKIKNMDKTNIGTLLKELVDPKSTELERDIAIKQKNKENEETENKNVTVDDDDEDLEGGEYYLMSLEEELKDDIANLNELQLCKIPFKEFINPNDNSFVQYIFLLLLY